MCDVVYFFLLVVLEMNFTNMRMLFDNHNSGNANYTQCTPPGYAEYFARNSDLSGSYWSPGLGACVEPYPNDGSRSSVWPERE